MADLPERRVILAAGLLAALAWLGGCTGPAPPEPPRPEISQLLVLPESLHLEAGGAANLAAQANDASGAPIGGAQFTFAAADERILRVSQSGEVIALGPVTPETFVVVASERLTRRIPVEVTPGRAARLEAESSDDRRGTAGEPPAPLLVRAVDAWGNGVPGVRIEAVLPRRQGPFPEAEADESGRATIGLPAFERAGRRDVIVRVAGDDSVQLRLSWLIEPAAAERLEIRQETDGRQVRVQVIARDRHANAVADVAVTARVRGARAGKWVEGRTDAAGVATFAFDLPAVRGRTPPVIEAQAAVDGAGAQLAASAPVTRSAPGGR